ncbi:hypothetical protein AHF37_01650 [Paragonimus kellicotti]|nr:hypothetical protein AHF37_01650 [Paragonimus kellicotti]
MACEGNAPNNKICSVCHDDIDYYAYGACNHPTCTKCILKLRKFGSADEPDFSKCPTCRRALNRIVIMDRLIPFDEIITSDLRHDSQYDFMFPTLDIEKHYRNMLKSCCPVCGEEKKSLSALNRHTTLVHQLSYCDLCIRYSRLLPCEFVPMKQSDLLEHRKWDKDRKKGHPMCEFCEERFYEMEDLISHIRDRHFLCDLCMTMGRFEVFREQCELLQHYGDSHYLCIECRARQRISCFATEERLGLHRFQEHPDEVAKDPNAWLPISIQLPPRNDGSTGRRRDPTQIDRVGGFLNPSDGRLVQDMTSDGYSARRPNPAEWTGDDFPSLSATISTVSSSLQKPDSPSAAEQMQVRKGEEPSKSTRKAVTSPSSMASVTSRGRSYQVTTDDFPTLPGSSSCSSIPLWRKNVCPVSPPKPSTIDARPKITTASDFPALTGQSSGSVSVVPALPSYVKKTKPMKNKTSGSPFILLTTKTSGANMRCQPRQPENLTSMYNCWENEDIQDFGPDGTRQPNDDHIQLADKLPNSSRNRLNHSQTLPGTATEDFPPLPVADVNLSRGSDKQALSDEVLKIDGHSSTKRTPSKKTVENQNWPPPPSGLTDTECILFANARYVPVKDAEVRNKQLIQTIETNLFDLGGKTAFTRFADVSRRYSHGQLTATSYMEALLGLLIRRTSGATKDEHPDSTVTPLWIAPMLALLPNIGLQRALLRAIQGQGAPRLPPEFQSNKSCRRSRDPVLPAPVWSKNVLSLLQCCRFCGQVCLRTDMSQHLQVAHPEN